MTKLPAPSDVADKFMLRMPDGMRDRLKAEADANGRSMNAEIVQRLESSFAPYQTSERDKFRISSLSTMAQAAITEAMKSVDFTLILTDKILELKEQLEDRKKEDSEEAN